MNTITLAIGADHRGYAHKEYLIAQSYQPHTISWIDMGTHTADRSDYPPYAYAVVQAIISGQADAGVLLCASGQGMAIAANRIPSIRAAVVWNVPVAVQAREDDEANILVIPSAYVEQALARDLIHAWLGAQTKGGRYRDRLVMLESLADQLIKQQAST